MWSRPITFLWLWPATDHEPHCRHVPINRIWRQTESTPRSGRWHSHMAAIYGDCSTREVINRLFLFAVSARCCVSGVSIGISHRHQQRLSEVRWNADFLWLDVPVIHGRRLPESSLVLHWPHVQTQQVRFVSVALFWKNLEMSVNVLAVREMSANWYCQLFCLCIAILKGFLVSKSF